MEHEDNTHLGQYLQTTTQNYMMENVQQQHNVAGVGVGVGGVGGVCGMGMGAGDVGEEILGGKYEGHHHEECDAGNDDDDEWKYVKEVQQSEKLQTMKVFEDEDEDEEEEGHSDRREYDDTNERAKEENIAAELKLGNGEGDAGNMLLLGEAAADSANVSGNGIEHYSGEHVFNIDNGVASAKTERMHELDVEEEMETTRNEGDFSTTSNITTSEEDHLLGNGSGGVGDGVSASVGDVMQVEMKIESSAVHEEHDLEEEEPSSLMTTTNGTSSLSENPQVMESHQRTAHDVNVLGTIEDKENADPLAEDVIGDSERPTTINLEHPHSQLNPDAKEFVPSFGSNPTSPISPTAMEARSEQIYEGEAEPQMYFGQQSQSSAVPRHLVGDDDFVAESPRKGRGADMDTIALPAEGEFENEAAQRPHELEQEDDDLVGVGESAMMAEPEKDEQPQPSSADNQLTSNGRADDDEVGATGDKVDSQQFASPTFGDHGPETCVDLEADNEEMLKPSSEVGITEEDDVMNRSVYISNEPIEDVLNRVQPLPTDTESIDNSFVEESAAESNAAGMVGDKELLHIEEKEHVSHSPSTEEMEMNVQNTLHSSVKDIPQIPIDMDSAGTMEESFYMEDNKVEQSVSSAQAEECLPADSMSSPNIGDMPVDDSSAQTAPAASTEPSAPIETPEFVDEPQPVYDVTTPSSPPYSTEEKHMVEETKEPQQFSTLEQQMSGMVWTTGDGHLSQVEEVVSPFTTAISNESENVINAVQEQPVHEEPEQAFDDEFEKEGVQHEPIEKQLGEELMGTDEKYEEEEKPREEPAEHVAQGIQMDISPEEGEVPEMRSERYGEEFAEITTPETEVVATKPIDEVSVEPNVGDITFENVPEPVEEPAVVALQSTPLYESDQMITATAPCDEEATVGVAVEPHLTEEIEVKPREVVESTEPTKLDSVKEEILEDERMFEVGVDVVAVTGTESTAEPITLTEFEPVKKEIFETERSPDVDVIAVSPTETGSTAEPTKLTEVESVEGKLTEGEKAPDADVTAGTPADTEITAEPTTLEFAQKEIHEAEKTATGLESTGEPNKLVELESAEKEIPEGEKTPGVDVAAATVVGAAIVAATAATAATVAPTASKIKTEAAKKYAPKHTTATARPKLGATTTVAKKPFTAEAKKPLAASKPTTATAPKPRAALTKTTPTTAEKKIASSVTTAAKPGAVTTARKILSTPSTAKSAPKTSVSARPTSVGVGVTAKTAAKPATASRTITTSTTTTTVRKAATSATTSGVVSKSRPASSAPTKPTTLGLMVNGVAKPKATSPRSTATTQLRKSAPTAGSTTPSKSPVKTTANGISAKTSPTAAASRTKTSTSGTTAKPFTARPAPKSSSVTTTITTTTRRLTLGTNGAATSTSTTQKTSSTAMRKSSPIKPSTLTGKTTPSKTPVGSSKSKVISHTKVSPSKTATPTATTTKITKKEDDVPKSNGTATPAEEEQKKQLDDDGVVVQEQTLVNGGAVVDVNLSAQIPQPAVDA